MPTIREIRRRIRSVTSTAKITRAMEMVAASKMRRAQLNALAARPYADKMRQMLADLAESIESQRLEAPHPLLARRDAERVAVVLVSTDRGLCGGLNANLNRFTASFALEQEGVEVKTVAVGRKGRDFLSRIDLQMIAEFTNLGDYPSFEDAGPIARLLIEEYIAGNVDRVYVIFPLFLNTMVQNPEARQLLPIEVPRRETAASLQYIYEPSAVDVFSELLPRYVQRQVYEAVLEKSASEQSARMVAMRSATDAANDMVQDLTLTYNKVRQETITKELLDIAGGAEALRSSE
ncbi:MAG: ATP synthase F1 subunit gamma [Dehalococcoidia bacterium]|jgi:F-type H+-transporting ATPase subunit gamma